MSSSPGAPVGVVMATRDRRDEVLHTLALLAALPGRPPIALVDNASGDGTVAAVRSAHPEVRVLALATNRGAAARTLGARALDTPYVAFADDDSDWAPAAFAQAAALFDAHPRLGLIAARVLVGSDRVPDPVCAQMADSPLRGDPRLPGRPVLGFVACGAIVRRDALLAVGGFHARFGIGGEEELLAVELAVHGHALRYVEEIVAHHRPADAREPGAERRTRQLRNALWTAWLRAPRELGARRSAQLLSGMRPDTVRGLGRAIAGAGWVAAERRPVGPALAADLALLWGLGAC